MDATDLRTDTNDPIAVTDKAAAKIAALAAKEGRESPTLRVRVTAGGCSGFAYKLSFEDDAVEGDEIVHGTGGVRVLIDAASIPIVRGSTLDFNDALMGGGLKMINPQATHECACGESFSI